VFSQLLYAALKGAIYVLSALTVTGIAVAPVAIGQENPARRMMVRNNKIITRIFIIYLFFFFGKYF